MPDITAFDDHAVVIELVRHTKDKLSHNENSNQRRKRNLICRLQKKFHEIDGAAFVPCRWSFGPYHNGDDHLKNMEKLISLDSVLNYVQDVPLEKYYEVLQSLEEEARSYYSEDIPIDTTGFLQMLLFDSCFIIDQLQILRIPPPPECNPQAQESFLNDIIHDLLLFENQIPFFILQRMYDVASSSANPTDHVASCVSHFLMSIIKKLIMGIKDSKETELVNKHGSLQQIFHFLHLFHWLLRPSKEQNDCPQVSNSGLINEVMPWCLVPRNWLAEKLGQLWCQTNNNQNVEFKRWRRAVEYHEAGVHFKVPLIVSNSPLDINFENGVLRIPKLIIDERTSLIFGNLLAFEQETNSGDHITTYLTFMSQLLSMPEDVTLLSRKGVIEHHLGCDEDVSGLFKNLTKFRTVSLGQEEFLKQVYCALEKHYGNRWNSWIAWLRHKHMKNPWLIFGLIVAAIVSISAIVQAVCSVIPFLHKHHQKKSG